MGKNRPNVFDSFSLDFDAAMRVAQGMEVVKTVLLVLAYYKAKKAVKKLFHKQNPKEKS